MFLFVHTITSTMSFVYKPPPVYNPPPLCISPLKTLTNEYKPRRYIRTFTVYLLTGPIIIYMLQIYLQFN